MNPIHYSMKLNQSLASNLQQAAALLPLTPTLLGDNHARYDGRDLHHLTDLGALLAHLHGELTHPTALPLLQPLLDFYPALSTKTLTVYDQSPDIFTSLAITLHPGQPYTAGVYRRRLTRSCAVEEHLVISNLILSESYRSPEEETARVNIHWTHPLFGLNLQVEHDCFRLDGHLHPLTRQHLHLGQPSITTLSLSDLQNCRQHGWKLLDTELGRIFIRDDQAIWQGRPLNLTRLRQQLSS